MGHELQQQQVILTTYVLYYVGNSFKILTNYPVRTLERTIPIWNSSKRVYLYIVFVNNLSKKKRVMRLAMRKPQDIPLKCFSAHLKELNNYLPLFPGSRSTKKMPPEELNKILPQAVLNGWAKQAYLQG